MINGFVPDEEYEKIFDFWKLVECFAPSDYPELLLKVKEYKKDVPFDAYYNEYSTRELPLDAYKAHNNYLRSKNVADGKLYNRANVYCGCYSLRKFVLKLAQACGLNIEKYGDINNLVGKFYIFSVQIDLDGKITEEGVQVSPFFHAVACKIKAKKINIMQESIVDLNEAINEILKQNAGEILDFKMVAPIKSIVFEKLRIISEEEVGLEGATKNVFACKGLRQEEESKDFNSFYLEDIEHVRNSYKYNDLVSRYVTAPLENKGGEIRIDNDHKIIKKWVDVDRYPLAKYPSKFSPTLMQQVAINIATSETDRKEKIFSVNGPPGTGKTTLLKEVIASNVEKMAEVLIGYTTSNKKFVEREIKSASSPKYTEKYFEIPEDIAQYGVLVVSNNNGAVENITLDLPKVDSVRKDNTWTEHFDRDIHEEVYFSAVADELLGGSETAWGLISARMGRKSYVSEVLNSCVFAKSNSSPEKVTLDLARECSISWDNAVSNFKEAKEKVLSFREEIKQDKKILSDLDREKEVLKQCKGALEKLCSDKDQMEQKMNGIQAQSERNEKDISNYKEEIRLFKKHFSLLKKLLVILHLGGGAKESC